MGLTQSSPVNHISTLAELADQPTDVNYGRQRDIASIVRGTLERLVFVLDNYVDGGALLLLGLVVLTMASPLLAVIAVAFITMVSGPNRLHAPNATA